MENCNCTPASNDSYEGWRESLSTQDLWLPFERLLNARANVAQCIAAIKKSERANVLALGMDVEQLHARRASREDRQAIRQLNTARSAFMDRMAKSDWLDLVQQLNLLVQEPETQEMIADFRERYVETLLENDLSASKTGHMLSLWDEASDSLQNNGFDGLINWTIGRIDLHLANRAAPDYGRAPNSPLTVAAALCVAAVVAATLAALVACAYIPFCWCCLAPLIAWGADEATKACSRL